MIIGLMSSADELPVTIGIQTEQTILEVKNQIYAIEKKRFELGCFPQFRDQLSSSEIALVHSRVFGSTVVRYPKLAMATDLLDTFSNWQSLSVVGRALALGDVTNDHIHNALLDIVVGLGHELSKDLK